tara:strand:- start:21 stop:224 length:204 start_codon:yes stop_codon:yes gene_type:complete
MSLEKKTGYFYKDDGTLIEYYNGYIDLDDMETALEYRKSAIGFVVSSQVNTDAYKYDLETETITEIG